jgi:hypothetical protein
MSARFVSSLCVGSFLLAGSLAAADDIEIFSRQNDFLPGWSQGGFGGVSSTVEDADGGKVISIALAPEATDYAGAVVKCRKDEIGNTVPITEEVKSSSLVIELNTKKPLEDKPGAGAGVKLQISMVVRLVDGRSKILQVHGQDVAGLTNAALDTDATTWETVRIPSSSFLKRLESGDEPEAIEGIHLQYSPKAQEEYVIGNIKLSSQ